MRNITIEQLVEPLRDRVSVNTAIPYIAGDGVGPEVNDAMRHVVDALLERLYGGKVRFTWLPLLAGEAALAQTGSHLPPETLEAIRIHRVAITGPLAIPTRGGERSAFRPSEQNKRKSVTLVHKDNVSKYMEGTFSRFGYEVAREEFPNITEHDLIADKMFQQIPLRPEEFNIIVTPNLNGSYLSDAVAAQLGGFDLAPGANPGNGCAIFEATHGTAPQIAGKDEVNPLGMILSAAMMLRHLEYADAAEALENAIVATLRRGWMTRDLAAHGTTGRGLKTSEFVEHLCATITSHAIGARTHILPATTAQSWL
jgi:isocitrate dehydrogenase